MRRTVTVCREVNEFGKFFDRDVAGIQVVLRAMRVQESDSVSFYGTIRYIMRL